MENMNAYRCQEVDETRQADQYWLSLSSLGERLNFFKKTDFYLKGSTFDVPHIIQVHGFRLATSK